MTQKIIGFDRDLDLEWLDAAAALAVSGASGDAARDSLAKLMSGKLSSGTPRGALQKTTTLLKRIWLEPDDVRRPLRDDASRVLADLDADGRLAAHWCLTIAAYPFFCDVMSAIGRLLTLQDRVSLNLVTRRMIEGWGARTTLPRAVRRVIRSSVQWGVLEDCAEKGVYMFSRPSTPLPIELEVLMVEAVLLASGQESSSFDQLAGHPALFPFRMTITPTDLRGATRLEVHRQGLDMDVVERRRGALSANMR